MLYLRKSHSDGTTLLTQIPFCGTTVFDTNVTSSCYYEHMSVFNFDIFNALRLLYRVEKAPETTLIKSQVTKTFS